MIASRPARTKAEKAALRQLQDNLRRQAEAVVGNALVTCPATHRTALLRSIIFAGSDRLATATCPVSTALLLCSTAARVSPNVRPLSPKARAQALFSTPTDEAA